MRKKGLQVVCAIMLACVTAVALASCGSGNAKDESSSDSTTSTKSAFLQEAQVQTEKNLAGGTFGHVPKTAPKPAQGKSIALIGCGENVQSCAQPIHVEKALAEELGWKVTTYDPQGDPTAAGELIRRAISANVDLISLYLIDCQYIAGPLRQAKAAGIPVIAAESFDCNVTDPSSEPLFTSEMLYAGGKTLSEFMTELGDAYAQYPIAKENGESNALLICDDTTTSCKTFVKAIQATYGACESCSLAVLEVPFTDIGTQLQSKVEQSLIKDPGINTVLAGYGDLFAGGVQAAVRAVRPDVLLGAGEIGNEAVFDSVKDKEADFAQAGTAEWEAYATIDTAIRTFAGEPAADSGLGVAIVNQESKLPAKPPWKPTVNFAAEYKGIWGLSE